MELSEKYVFHIPLCKYSNGKLIPINRDDVLDDLICMLHQSGYENLYITNVKGFYKTRRYDEKLITIYTSRDIKAGQMLPDEIFRKWFLNSNDVLQQEALAYEYNDTLFVEKIQ